MGITLHKTSGKYQVQVTEDGKFRYIGLYNTLEEAKLVDDKYIKTNINKNHKNYVEERLLRYHMLVSLNQGFLTKEMSDYIILIVKNVHRKFRYKSSDDKWDCFSYSVENILRNWFNYDQYRYELVLPYLVEISKRGFAMQFNNINKHSKNHISIDSYGRDGNRMNI